MEIKISNYLMKKIEKFANDRVGLSADEYAKRGEKRVNKMIEDIICGCMGEYAVFQLLKSQGIKCSKPDLKIYEVKQKSFDADLRSDEWNIHVKCQTTASAERYGYSYLCQRYDKLVKKPKSDDLMAFCCADIATKTVTFLGFCKAENIKKCDLWDNCKVPMFRRTKVALYLTKFEDYGIIEKDIADIG